MKCWAAGTGRDLDLVDLLDTRMTFFHLVLDLVLFLVP
jgi:hypothetical protein